MYFYIKVGHSTSNVGYKGETLRHMTWAKAHLMVVGGLLRQPITELAGYDCPSVGSIIIHSESFLNPDLTDSEWPAKARTGYRLDQYQPNQGTGYISVQRPPSIHLSVLVRFRFALVLHQPWQTWP
jgi:hypothetical protein